jgi:hypothetical protein
MRMTELIIDDVIAERLRRIAQEENRPLDAVLLSMLETYTNAPLPSDWPLMMAKMAEADTDIVWNESASDLSESSRDFLENSL